MKKTVLVVFIACTTIAPLIVGTNVAFKDSHSQPKKVDFSADWETLSLSDPAAVSSPSATNYDFTHTLLGEYDTYKPSSPILYFYYGIVGNTNRRLDVHIETVAQDSQDKTLYHVTGKDRYKGIISSFDGTITVTHVSTYNTVETPDNDPPNLHGGSLIGSYSFNETGSLHPSSFKGTVVSKWYVDPKTHTLRYYDLSPADGSKNNVFVGTRTDASGTIEKAIWGDGFFFRPYADDFAKGAGDWVVQSPYNTTANGWGWSDFDDPLPTDWWK